MTISLKTIDMSEEKHGFRGCGILECSKDLVFGCLTNVSYSVFCEDFHCGNEDFFDEANDGLYPIHIVLIQFLIV